MLIIRAAVPDDAEAVADLYLPSRRELVAFAPLVHSEDEVRSRIRSHLIPSGAVTVAVRDGAIVGLGRRSSPADGSWIDQLYVDPGCIGSGIGTEFLEFAHGSLVPPIRLFTFRANSLARTFYERRGFRAVRFSNGAINEERCPDVLYEWT